MAGHGSYGVPSAADRDGWRTVRWQRARRGWWLTQVPWALVVWLLAWGLSGSVRVGVVVVVALGLGDWGVRAWRRHRMLAAAAAQVRAALNQGREPLSKT